MRNLFVSLILACGLSAAATSAIASSTAAAHFHYGKVLVSDMEAAPDQGVISFINNTSCSDNVYGYFPSDGSNGQYSLGVAGSPTDELTWNDVFPYVVFHVLSSQGNQVFPNSSHPSDQVYPGETIFISSC